MQKLHVRRGDVYKRQVVPGYYLVCYNRSMTGWYSTPAVVPGYYLVCYNTNFGTNDFHIAVVPGYYLVCYNRVTGRRPS